MTSGIRKLSHNRIHTIVETGQLRTHLLTALSLRSKSARAPVSIPSSVIAYYVRRCPRNPVISDRLLASALISSLGAHTQADRVLFDEILHLDERAVHDIWRTRPGLRFLAHLTTTVTAASACAGDGSSQVPTTVGDVMRAMSNHVRGSSLPPLDQ